MEEDVKKDNVEVQEEKESTIRPYDDETEETIFQYVIRTIFPFVRVERLYYKYAGEVKSDGTTLTPFFKKITAEKTATGTYKLTHNFKTQSYTVFAMPKSTGARMTSLDSKNDSDCTIKIYNDAGTATDTDFDFLLLLY